MLRKARDERVKDVTMKKKPIIFSTPMVQAILDGKKTQTRRVIKPQPDALSTSENLIVEYGKLKRIWRGAMSLWQSKTEGKPKYNIGDVLWVREAWRVSHLGIAGGDEWAHIVYKCGKNKSIDVKSNEKSLFYASKAKWQSPLFLPREAARIFLEVKSVRVERLQDISEKDAYAEGMDSPSYPIIQFKDLWRELNSKRGGCSWENNPWVWVYEFMRAEK